MEWGAKIGRKWSQSPPPWGSSLKEKITHQYAANKISKANGITELLNALSPKLHTRRLRDGSVREQLNYQLPLGQSTLAFDDNIIEERWPDSAKIEDAQPSHNLNGKCVLIPVIYEGAPSKLVAKALSQVAQAKCLAATPIDFVCSTYRYFILPHPKSKQVAALNAAEKRLRLKNGMAAFIRTPQLLDFDFSNYPQLSRNLPDLSRKVLIRGSNGSLQQIIFRCEIVKKNGFINYTQGRRYDRPLSSWAALGRHLLHRDYCAASKQYMFMLTGGSALILNELKRFTSALDAMSNQRLKEQEWKAAKMAITSIHKQEEAMYNVRGCGLDPTASEALQDFVTRMCDSKGNPLPVWRGMPRTVIFVALRSLIDLHWNSLASLRLRLHGNEVVAGDLVCANRSRRFDAVCYPEDSTTGMGVLTPPWSDEWCEGIADCQLEDFSDPDIVVVSDSEMARQFSLKDVILPKIGRGRDTVQLPLNKCGASCIEQLINRLDMGGIDKLMFSPSATYRRLVHVPSELEFCCFDNVHEFSYGEDHFSPEMWTDSDGLRRLASPLKKELLMNIDLRGGIRHPAREVLLQTAREGLTTALSLRLPRGVALSSFTRDIFDEKRFTSSVAYSMMQASAAHSKQHSR